VCYVHEVFLKKKSILIYYFKNKHIEKHMLNNIRRKKPSLKKKLGEKNLDPTEKTLYG